MSMAMCCRDLLLLLALSITSTQGMTPRKEWTEAATECESKGTRLPTSSEAVSMNLGDVWVLDRLYYTTWFYLRSCVNASSLINETGALFVVDPLKCFAFCKSRGQAMNLQMSIPDSALCSCSARTNEVGFSRSCGRCFDDSYFVCGLNNSFVAQYTWVEEMIPESSTSKPNWESDMCLTVGCVQTDTGLGFEFNEKDCAEANVPFCALEDIKEMTVDTKYKPFNETFDICPVGYPVFSTNITCSVSSSPSPHWVNAFRLLKTCYSWNDPDCQQFMIENPPTFECQKTKNKDLETKKCDDDIKFFCVDKNDSSTTMTPTTQNIISVSVESSSDTTTVMGVESSTMPQNETIEKGNGTLGQDKQESPITKAFPTGIVLGVVLPLVAASIGVLFYCLIRRKKTMSTKKALSEGDRGNTTGPYTLPYDCVKNDEVNRSSFYAQTTEANPSESEPSNQHTNEYVLPKDDLQHIADGNQYEQIQDSVLDKSNATVIQQLDTANYSECNLDCYDKLHQNESLKNSSHDQYDKVKVIVQDDKEADDYDHLGLDSNKHSNGNCLYYSSQNNLGTNKESIYNSLNEEEHNDEVCYS